MKPEAITIARIALVTGLTHRQAQILLLISLDESEKMIADKLGISERTISTHATNIRRKIGHQTRTRALHYLFAQGLIPVVHDWAALDLSEVYQARTTREVSSHCVNGHEFTAENTAHSTKGYRMCRQCTREHTKRWNDIRQRRKVEQRNVIL